MEERILCFLIVNDASNIAKNYQEILPRTNITKAVGYQLETFYKTKFKQDSASVVVARG